MVTTVIRSFQKIFRRTQRLRRPLSNAAYSLYEYRDADGKFDYEAYRRIQTEGNRRKINNVWVSEDNIKFLADYLQKIIETPQFGLCHGTRRGLEQKWFRDTLGCDVLGTEISDTAEEFPNTIQWDFHDVKPEWIDAVDFIYSNSFDHSYDPETCLNTWMSCLKPGGICFLEHTDSHTPEAATELDPFGAAIEIMPYLITKWAKGRYFVREILDGPGLSYGVEKVRYLVIERR